MTGIEIGAIAGVVTILVGVISIGAMFFNFFKKSIITQVDANKELIESQTTSSNKNIEKNQANIVKLFDELATRSKRDASCSEYHAKNLVDAIDKVISKTSTEVKNGLDTLKCEFNQKLEYQTRIQKEVEKRRDEEIDNLKNRTNKVEEETKKAIDKIENELKEQSSMLSDIKAMLVETKKAEILKGN